MNMGAKSGIGRGLAQAGQQILNAVTNKRFLEFEQQKLDRNMAHKTRYLASQFGWMDELRKLRGGAGGSQPTGATTPPAAAAPAPTPPAADPSVHGAGPMRFPGGNMPRMPSPAAPMVGANMLGRQPDEEFYG
jgi:hypothetical protein